MPSAAAMVDYGGHRPQSAVRRPKAEGAQLTRRATAKSVLFRPTRFREAAREVFDAPRRRHEGGRYVGQWRSAQRQRRRSGQLALSSTACLLQAEAQILLTFAVARGVAKRRFDHDQAGSGRCSAFRTSSCGDRVRRPEERLPPRNNNANDDANVMMSPG